MKNKLILILTMVFFLSGFSSGENIPDFNAQSGLSKEQKIQELTKCLKNIEDRYINKLNYSDRDQALKELNYIYYLIYQIGGNIPPEEDQPQSMNNNDFRSFIQSLKSLSFDREKVSTISSVVKANNFNIAQTLQIIESFDFDDNKIAVLKIIYPKVTDKNNGYKLLDAFTYDMYKDKVKQIIDASY